MCGVLGLVSHEPVNQMLYDGLQMLQHRGQDAAGIVTAEGNIFHMHKGKGMVREVFRTRNMRDLVGNAGIAHVRYPTAGNAGSSAEAQPFYVSSPFGIVLAHNGNLTNTEELYATNTCATLIPAPILKSYSMYSHTNYAAKSLKIQPLINLPSTIFSTPFPKYTAWCAAHTA